MISFERARRCGSLEPGLIWSRPSHSDVWRSTVRRLSVLGVCVAFLLAGCTDSGGAEDVAATPQPSQTVEQTAQRQEYERITWVRAHPFPHPAPLSEPLFVGPHRVVATELDCKRQAAAIPGASPQTLREWALAATGKPRTNSTAVVVRMAPSSATILVLSRKDDLQSIWDLSRVRLSRQWLPDSMTYCVQSK